MPVLQYLLNGHQRSITTGMTFTRFYFRLSPGAIKGAHIVALFHTLGRR